MCELKVVKDNEVIMEDVIRITVKENTIRLFGLLGEIKDIQGKISDINLTKQEAIIRD
ncbi:MAG: CooT family nickel-binding protein, partial [Methanosarcinales archaeon]